MSVMDGSEFQTLIAIGGRVSSTIRSSLKWEDYPFPARRHSDVTTRQDIALP
jgi:hypothetical protein